MPACTACPACLPSPQIQLEIYHEGATGASSRRGLGTAGRLLPGQHVFQAELRLAFPAARAADCGSAAREALRAGLAAAAGVSPLAVSIERVLAPTAARPHLEVLVHVQMGADLLAANELVKAVGGAAGPDGSASPTSSCRVASNEEESDMEAVEPEGAAQAPAPAEQEREREEERELRRRRLAALLGGEQVTAALGLPDPRLCGGEITDVTPACAGANEAERAQQEALNRADAEVAPEQERRLVVVSCVQRQQHFSRGLTQTAALSQ